jgi:hypothetical protein
MRIVAIAAAVIFTVLVLAAITVHVIKQNRAVAACQSAYGPNVETCAR